MFVVVRVARDRHAAEFRLEKIERRLRHVRALDPVGIVRIGDRGDEHADIVSVRILEGLVDRIPALRPIDGEHALLLPDDEIAGRLQDRKVGVERVGLELGIDGLIVDVAEAGVDGDLDAGKLLLERAGRHLVERRRPAAVDHERALLLRPLVELRRRLCRERTRDDEGGEDKDGRKRLHRSGTRAQARAGRLSHGGFLPGALWRRVNRRLDERAAWCKSMPPNSSRARCASGPAVRPTRSTSLQSAPRRCR